MDAAELQALLAAHQEQHNDLRRAVEKVWGQYAAAAQQAQDALTQCAQQSTTIAQLTGQRDQARRYVQEVEQRLREMQTELLRTREQMAAMEGHPDVVAARAQAVEAERQRLLALLAQLPPAPSPPPA